MQPPKISIILVQYNNSDDVVKCLESIRNSIKNQVLSIKENRNQASDFVLDIIVVDNASDPKHLEITKNYLDLHKFELNTCYLTFTTNSGYSGGNNVGIKYALEHGADYVLILNPDTTLEPNAISKMVKVAGSEAKIGAVGPVIDEGFRKIYGGKIQWLKPELSHIQKEAPNKTSGAGGESFLRVLASKSDSRRPYVRGKNFLTGACLLIKRDVLEKTGLFDERYFLYFEDADLCLRIQKAGFKLAIAEKALIHHQVSAATSKLGSARLLRYHYRNALLFNLKNGPWWAKVLLPFWSLGIMIKQSVKIILNRERLISRKILLGVLDFHLNQFGKI